MNNIFTKQRPINLLSSLIATGIADMAITYLHNNKVVNSNYRPGDITKSLLNHKIKTNPELNSIFRRR